MALRLQAALRGELAVILRAEARGAETAVTKGMRRAVSGLKAELRGQVTGAGLGGRLARTWRGAVYPESGRSASAAGFVYSKAPEIIRAFSEGATIRARRERYLAVPTPAAPRRGVDGKRISPANWPQGRLGPLRFVARAGKPPLLVADGLVARGGRRGGFRRATTRKATRRRGAFVALKGLTTVVMFVLVPQVRLEKRLALERARAKALARLPRLIVDAWPNERTRR